MPNQDPYGFRFWLTWILGFAGSFLISAVLWTAVVFGVFRTLMEPELGMLWAVAVFGTWFLLFAAFMRKKERIWKRLNQDEEKAADAWLDGLHAFIGALVLSAFVWAWIYRDRILADAGRVEPAWIRAVLGTWLALALPFLVYLYRRADRIFKAAEERQSRRGPVFKTCFLEKTKRLLPESVAAKIKNFPETMEGAHVVTLILKSKERVQDVFVRQGREVLGVYDREILNFETVDVLDAELQSEFQAYDESKWLRLDGRA